LQKLFESLNSEAVKKIK